MLKTLLRWLLAALMIGVGSLHFISPQPFVQIVPNILPEPLLLVYISGFFEILGGVGLILPWVSRWAAWGLIVLYIAVFPANINMALNKIILDGLPYLPVLYWARLPLQAVLILWAWWYTEEQQLN